MFEITEKAAARIKHSQAKLGEESLRLRISARFRPEYGVAYKMGFDEKYATDVTLEINNIKVIYDRESEKWINGMIIDYRELDGEMQIVFENPNDVDRKQLASETSTDE